MRQINIDTGQSEMKHIFLTGERRSGKTTIINKIISRQPKKNLIKGFRTYKRANHIPDHDCVLLESVNGSTTDDTGNTVELNTHIIRSYDKKRSDVRLYPKVFNTVGVGLLSNNANTDLIIIDEIGFLEADAKLFQNTVIRLLDGNIPVLGAIRLESNPFLDRVREHPKVEIIKVTPENREELVDLIERRLS